jgi:bacterioferritin-associated ferredoxin
VSRTLDAIGCRVPKGVEVFSDVPAIRPCAEVCGDLATSARRVLEAARSDASALRLC